MHLTKEEVVVHEAVRQQNQNEDRIEPALKAEVEKLFKQLGLSTTEAINLFYRQIKMRKGLPFKVVIPNKTTEKVFKETDIKRNLIRCDGTDDMLEKLGI